MKRTLLFIACVLASITMLAQEEPDDYIPFVEPGKTWHVESSPVTYKQYYHFLTYWMNETEEIDGKTYFRLKQKENPSADVYDVGLFREENRRVYKYDEMERREIMLYDFSLKEGDTFVYELDAGILINGKVLKQGWLTDGPQIVSSVTSVSADSLDVKYRWLRTWSIGRDDGAGGYHEFLTWVEGVGTLVNTFCPLCLGGMNAVAYVERNDYTTDFLSNNYLPFSFYNMFGLVHGCNLPTGKTDSDSDRHHQLTYEQDGDRLHVYGKVYTQCGPNNYAYFIEEPTEDPLVHRLHFRIQEVEPLADCMALHATNFYVPGFDPNMNYIVVDNQGEEHPVVNKIPQLAYRPFVEDSKVWTVGALNSGNPVQWVEHFYFDGDTIIDGKTCKQMMRQRYVSHDFPEYYSDRSSLSCVGAWYEEEKKVYQYDSTNLQFKLMYDFSADANDTLQIDNQSYVIGPRQTGGLTGFKGIYRNVEHVGGGCSLKWLEGVGSLDCTTNNVYPGPVDPMWFLMSCTVGDEVIYLLDGAEDGATPDVLSAPKKRFDFTHTIKTKPQARNKKGAGEVQSLYGEYNEQKLGIHLDPLDDAYVVRITGEQGKVAYEKTINAGSIVGLDIDISAYAVGRYSVTVENSQEVFTGEFEVLTAGIEENVKIENNKNENIYNLQGQRISSLQKGLNIVNGRKVYVK